jgi:hypothetical protein
MDANLPQPWRVPVKPHARLRRVQRSTFLFAFKAKGTLSCLEGFTGSTAVVLERWIGGGRLRQPPFAALVKFAAIKAVVDHDAIIVRRAAPAASNRMLAEIVDRIDVVSVNLPCQLWNGSILHARFLVSDRTLIPKLTLGGEGNVLVRSLDPEEFRERLGDQESAFLLNLQP